MINFKVSCRPMKKILFCYAAQAAPREGISGDSMLPGEYIGLLACCCFIFSQGVRQFLKGLCMAAPTGYSHLQLLDDVSLVDIGLVCFRVVYFFDQIPAFHWVFLLWDCKWDSISLWCVFFPVIGAWLITYQPCFFQGSSGI